MLFCIPLPSWPNKIQHVLWQIARDFLSLEQTTSPKSGRLRCRWKWVWSIGGIILTTEDYSARTKPVPVPLCPPQIWHRVTWDRTRGPAVIPEPQQDHWTWNLTWIETQSVPRSKHSISFINTNHLMLYREIMAVCSDSHAIHKFPNVKPGGTVHIVTTGLEWVQFCSQNQ